MFGYITKRILLAIPTLIAISLVTFVVINLAPRDPPRPHTPDAHPVADKIRELLWPPISLALLSIFISLALSIPIGIYAAARQDRCFDTISSTILYGLYSVPSYVMAVPLILLLGVQWDLLPFQ